MLPVSESHLRIAIIGGGPGGLFAAFRLLKQATFPYDLTIFEGSSRLGGKVRTATFETAPVSYEAGAAELYDYSNVGEDPLKELILSLGLRVQPMEGRSVVREGQIFANAKQFAEAHGEGTRRALAGFDARARAWCSPQDYYEADWSEAGVAGPDDPMRRHTFAEELDRLEDEDARQYIETLTHSDVATEPHRTSAAYGLQNYLMNEPEYMRLYTIGGGIEQLMIALAAQIEARVLLESRVERVERQPEGRLRLTVRDNSHDGGQCFTEEFDYVVTALPVTHLQGIAWRGGGLPAAMRRHHEHYDYPAHYLRVSVLFREVFWSDVLRESYLMLDSFGGCCLYDESARNGSTGYGALGWLLAGEPAMIMANLPDERIIESVLGALPEFLRQGASMVLEARVHRWIGEVSGMPGGPYTLPVETRHMPDPDTPNLLLVGDYLFDSTLNGVLDSAEFVVEHLCDQVQPEPQLAAIAGAAS